MPTIQDLYATEVLSHGEVSAYYLCDDTSGTIVDSRNCDGDHRLDLINLSGSITYGLPGPFEGASAIEFQSDGTTPAYAETAGFTVVCGNSSNIGDECIAMHAWVYIPVEPGTWTHLMNGHGGLSAEMGESPPSVFGPGRYMRTGIVNFGWTDASSFQIPLNEWHYVSYQHHATTGENHHVLDTTDEDANQNTSVPTGTTQVFQLGLNGGGPVPVPIATVRFSNVVFTRGCPNPILFPTPSKRRPQIYRRVHN